MLSKEYVMGLISELDGEGRNKARSELSKLASERIQEDRSYRNYLIFTARRALEVSK